MTGKHARRHAIAVRGRPADAGSRPLGARVRRGAVWSVAAAIFLRLSNVFTTAIAAHVFSRSEFGVFTIALTANTIVTIVGQFGLTSCLTRADLDLDSLAPTMLTFSVGTNLMQAGAMFVFAREIATALGSTAAAGPVRVLAIAQVIVGFAEIPNSQLAREFRQDKLFLAQLAGSVPQTALLVALVLAGTGPVAYAWSLDLGIFLSGCVVFSSVRRHYLPAFKRGALLVLVRFGFPLGMANIVNVVLLNVDYALIGHLIGAEALGSYVLAFGVATWPASILGTMLTWVGVPAFSRIKDDRAALQKAVVGALRAFSLVVLPMSALTIALSGPLIVSFYGAKWAASVPVLQMLAIYGAASVICTLYTNMLAGLGRSKFLFIVQVVWLGALLPAMVIGTRLHGIYGAAVAHVAVIGGLVIPCYLVIVKRLTGVRFGELLRAVLPALAASAVAGIVARLVSSQFTAPPVQLAAGLTVGSVLYVLAVAPQAIKMFSRVQASQPYVANIVRVCHRAARLMALPGYRPARHSRRSRQQHRRPAPEPTVARSGPPPPRAGGTDGWPEEDPGGQLPAKVLPAN